VTERKPARNTAAANEARRAATTTLIIQVEHALKQLAREQSTITVANTARRAGVSRTFLYQNADARALVERYADKAAIAKTRAKSAQDLDAQATWRERARNAEDALAAAHREISGQRDTMADLLGRIRDLESDIPKDSAQRLITENRTLKHQVRQLSEAKDRLQERLTSARDNNRFLDNRIADLEAQLSAT
jgi:uncharacterized coiled-coil protein SlyX